jgi:ribosome-binding factor A
MSKKSKRPPSQRQLRVGEELRHVLSQIIERDKLRDPDLAGVSITISEVSISPDLGNATAFVTRLGGGEPDKIVAALRRATPFLRYEIAKRVELRRVPNIIFEADTTFDYVAKIDGILSTVNAESVNKSNQANEFFEDKD